MIAKDEFYVTWSYIQVFDNACLEVQRMNKLLKLLSSDGVR